MTIGEAHVAEENWPKLRDAYAAAIKQLGPGIVQTYLVHNWSDPTLWQIITTWESREALMAIRQTHQTAAADLMFQAAGAEPTHAVFDIAMQEKAG